MVRMKDKSSNFVRSYDCALLRMCDSMSVFKGSKRMKEKEKVCLCEVFRYAFTRGNMRKSTYRCVNVNMWYMSIQLCLSTNEELQLLNFISSLKEYEKFGICVDLLSRLYKLCA